MIYLNDLKFFKWIHIILFCHYFHTVKVDCFKYRATNIYKTIFMVKIFRVEKAWQEANDYFCVWLFKTIHKNNTFILK